MELLKLALAVKVLSDMIRTKRGPFGLLAAFRAIPSSELQQALACETCTGLYVAVVLAAAAKKWRTFAGLVDILAALELGLLLGDLIGVLYAEFNRTGNEH